MPVNQVLRHLPHCRLRQDLIASIGTLIPTLLDDSVWRDSRCVVCKENVKVIRNGVVDYLEFIIRPHEPPLTEYLAPGSTIYLKRLPVQCLEGIFVILQVNQSSTTGLDDIRIDGRKVALIRIRLLVKVYVVISSYEDNLAR